MRPAVARREMVRQALARHWGVKSAELLLIRHGENTVYRVRTARRDCVARLSTPVFQTPASVRGELRFIAHCAAHGLRTAAPLPTRHGEMIALVPNLDPSAPQTAERIVSLFPFMPGRRPSLEQASLSLFSRWGATLARLHLAAESFRQTPAARRPIWDEKEFQGDPLRYRPLGGEAWFRRAWRACEKWLRALPREEWGLIHADLHHKNFKVHEGEIHVFDFDDAFVGWYAYDLAVVWKVLEERGGAAWQAERRRAVMEGYRAVRDFPAGWEERLPGFVRVRGVWMAAWGAARLDVPLVRRWHARFVTRLREALAREADPF